MINQSNDYELLYLAKEENCDLAHMALFGKYRQLIYKTIFSLGVCHGQAEDYFDEAQLVFLKAVQTFDEHHQKTFTKYFQLVLYRHLLHMKRKNNRYLIDDDFDIVDESETFDLPPNKLDFAFKNNTMQLVYEQYFINQLSVKTVETKHNLSPKQIYNAIYRIKAQIKDTLS